MVSGIKSLIAPQAFPSTRLLYLGAFGIAVCSFVYADLPSTRLTSEKLQLRSFKRVGLYRHKFFTAAAWVLSQVSAVVSTNIDVLQNTVLGQRLLVDR